MSYTPGIFIAPMGKYIIGNTLDCNKKMLERALQFYDKQLYLQWNPKKRGGWGKWEIRRRPDVYTKVYQGEWQGASLYTSELRELDLVNHVLDLDVLHMDALGKIKRMDTWKNKNFATDLEKFEAEHRQKMESKAREDLAYDIKQHKREWREFAQLVSSGMNPAAAWKGKRG